jgi:hypothetical protein
MDVYIGIGELWLPVVCSAAAVFVASCVVWMVLPHHRSDWGTLPDEEGLMASLRRAGLRPGQYCFPSADGDMKKMGTPEFQEKLARGPVGTMVVGPNGPPAMGRSMAIWFVYVLGVGVAVAYLSGRTLAPGAAGTEVFRMAGAVAVLSFAMGVLPAAIWEGQRWGYVLKKALDGVLYGLITGALFAWLWPGA